MNTMTDTRYWIATLTALALGLAATPAWSQVAGASHTTEAVTMATPAEGADKGGEAEASPEAAPEAKPDKAVDTEAAPANTKGAAEASEADAKADPDPNAAPAAAPGLPDEETFDEIFKTVSPEEMERLIKEAENNRLSDERAKAVDEIRDNLLYELDAPKAVKILQAKPAADTRVDNIQRIMNALAVVDRRFGKAMKLYKEGEYAQSATEAEAIANVDDSTYLNAAAHLLRADALVALGNKLAKEGPEQKLASRKARFNAIQTYDRLGRLMPERVSFAVEAALRAGQTAEQLDRYYYAMQAYANCLNQYGLTMEADEYETIRLRAKKWADLYEKPFNAVAGMMEGVEKRLKRYDSGEQTQDEGEQIVLVLEDLIKTAEEQSQSQGGGGQGQKSKKQQKKKDGSGSASASGQGQAQGKSGSPSGTQQPSSPASTSALPGGAAQRPDPDKASDVRTTRETGDWAKLPPRQRQEIEEYIKRRNSEKGREQVRDYWSALADDEDSE